MFTKLAIAQLLSVPQPCFVLRMRPKTSGQCSSVELYKEALCEASLIKALLLDFPNESLAK